MGLRSAGYNGGNYTFYGRMVNWTAADNREPLATRWGTGRHGYQPGDYLARSEVAPATFSCAAGCPITPRSGRRACRS